MGKRRPEGVHCSICLDTFPGPQRSPVVLGCGHALCKACCEGGQSKIQLRRCPLCKAGLNEPGRPSHALGLALRHFNALPIAEGSQALRQSMDDLQACHARVKKHRVDEAVAQARPLHDAIIQGDDAGVERLLATGADCNALVSGVSALHVAARFRRFHLIRPLLDHGADPKVKSEPSQETALLLASAADDNSIKTTPERLQAMRDMMDFVGFDAANELVRAASSSGATPLLYSCRRLQQVQSAIFSGDSFDQELAVAKLLVKCDADMNAVDMFGQSPAGVVAELSRQDVLQNILGVETCTEAFGAWRQS